MSSPFQICGPTDCDCIYGAGTSQAATCKELLKQGPGVHVGVDTKAITDPLSSLSQNLLQSLLQPLLNALPSIGIKVGLFAFALMLLIIGFMIVSSDQ